MQFLLTDFNKFFYHNTGNIFISLLIKHTEFLKTGLLHNPKQPQIRDETRVISASLALRFMWESNPQAHSKSAFQASAVLLLSKVKWKRLTEKCPLFLVAEF